MIHSVTITENEGSIQYCMYNLTADAIRLKKYVCEVRKKRFHSIQDVTQML